MKSNIQKLNFVMAKLCLRDCYGGKGVGWHRWGACRCAGKCGGRMGVRIEKLSV